MPSHKELASELWLHVNSPETLDKIVGDRVAQLRRDARFDELTDFQNERKEIDDTVEKYLASPAFEKHREIFREIDDKDSPELERAVAEMAQELRYGNQDMSQKGREETMKQIGSDVATFDRTLQQETQLDEQKHDEQQQER